jgi:hypothetical protein
MLCHTRSLKVRIFEIVVIIPSLCWGATFQNPARHRLPGTPFLVTIPAGWRVEPPTSSSPPRIVRITQPVYSVAVIHASGRSCARRFKDTESSVSHARTAHPELPFLATKPRPSFIPSDYAGVVQTTGNLVSTCLDLGGGARWALSWTQSEIVGN